MAVKLRLRRLGRTHLPYYQIVAAASTSPRDGKFIEKIGQYDPLKQFDGVEMDHEVALKWLRNGAQPTETVKSIFSREGVMLRFHLERQGKTQDEVQAAYEKWLQERNGKLDKKKSGIGSEKTKKAAAALEAEKKRNEDRLAKIAAKNAPAPVAVEEEAAPAEEAATEAAE